MSQIVKPSVASSVIDRTHPIGKSILGAWLFNEGGGLKACDIGGLKNHGVLTNGPTWTTGRGGRGIQFDGTDSNVVTTHKDQYNVGTGDYSFAVWYKTPGKTGTAQPEVIGTKDNAATGTGILMYCMSDGGDDPGKIRFYSGGSLYAMSTGRVDDNKWHHFVGIRKNGVLWIYVDGLANGSQAYTGTPDVSTNDFWIFGSYPGGAYPAVGVIDSAIFFKRALSAAEIRSLYVDPYPFILKPRRVFKAPAGGLPGRTAEANISLGAITLASTAENAIAAASTQNLGAATSSGEGANAIDAAAVINLGAATSAGTAENAIATAGTVSLGAASSSGAASVAVGAVGSVSLGGIAIEGAATVALAAASSQSIGAITVSGTAGALPGITAGASISIGAISLTSTATSAIGGQASITIGAVTCSGNNISLSVTQDTALTTGFTSSALTTGFDSGALTTGFDSDILTTLYESR